MRATSLLNTLVTFILLFTTVSASWRWSLFDRDTTDALLDRRQENENQGSSQTSTPTATRTTASGSQTSSDENESSSPTTSDENESASASGSGTASASGSGTASITGGNRGNSTRTSSGSTKSTPVDPRLPAGGVSIISPAVTAGSQYYKVGDTVTFEWNYTSLSNTPSAVDVFATCSLNQATYTITSNMTVEATGRVLWDTGDQNEYTAGFPVATYTLYIHDAARDPTQVASAGDLAAYNQLRFGVYTGQPYTPLNEFKCSTCSAALSMYERQALGVLGVTVALTVVSFTVFAGNAGLFAL